MTQERDLKTELDALDEQSANPVESWPENVFSQGTSDAVKALGVEDAIARATQEQEAARKAEQEQSVIDNAREAVRIDAENAQAQQRRGVFGDSFGVLTPEESQTAAKSEYDWSKWLADRTAKGAEFFNQPSQSILDSVLKYNPVGLIQGATMRGLDASQGKRFKAAEDVMEGRAPMPELTPTRAFIENTIRGAANAFVVDTIQSLGIARGYATKLSGGKYLEQADQLKVDPSDDPLYKIGLNVEEFVKKQFPGDAARQQQFAQQLAQGVGSTAGFAGSGWLGKVAGLGERGVLALIGLTGAASQSAQTFKEVTAALKKGDATETDRTLNMLAAIALGATEAAPFAPTIGPGLKLGARAASAIEQATEESLQEGVQQFGQNLVTQQTYDPNQTLMEGVPEGMAIGGLTGGAFGGAMGGHANVAAQSGDNKPVQEARLRTPNTATDAGPAAPADTRPVAPMMEGPAQRGAPGTRAEPEVFSEPDLEAARKAIQQAAQGLPLDTVAEPAPVEETAPEPTAEPVEAETGDANTQIANEVSNFLDIPDEYRADVEDAVRAVDQMVSDDQLDLPAVFADIEQYLAENEIDTDISDDDVKAIARAVYEGKDLGAAVDRALGIEDAKPEAEAEPTGPSDEARQKFAEVLASSTPRSQWAEATGVDPDTLNSLINEAVSDGRMEIRFGKPVRKAAARVAPPKPERPAAPASAPVLLRSEEKRLEAVKSDKAYQAVASLFNTRGSDAFQSALDALYSDKSIKNADLAQITKAFTGKRAKPKNRQDAINKLSQAHTAWVARNKGKGTNANRADVGQGQGSVSQGGISEAVRQDGEGRDTGGAPEVSGAGRAGDVGGRTVSPGEQPGSAAGLRPEGEEAGSDTGAGARDGQQRMDTPTAEPVTAPAVPRERTAEEIAAINADLAAEQEELEAQRRDRTSRNYKITDADKVGQGGPKQKVRANIAAIETLKKIEEENRPATDEEKAILVKYVGWGAFSQPIFKDYNQEFAKERNAIKSLLSPEEYAGARASTVNAHYTSPDVIKAMWGGLDHLGFKGGRALEPAAGIGHFIGLQPEGTREDTAWTAVELDPISARITKALYGAADVREGGFEAQKWPNDFFDLAISNVPFDATGPYDPEYKKRYSLHDYFFIKALDKVRPGGVVAFITSRYTLDKVRDAVRRDMEKRGTFLGAIRLPGGNQGAFKSNAGTDVTTDIIFLRKRMQGEPVDLNADWMKLETIKTPEGDVLVNGYFAKNPDMMLGKMRLIGSMYGKGEPVLIGPTDNLDERIAEAAKNLPENAMTDRGTVVAPVDEVDTKADGIKEGAFYEKDGTLYRKIAGVGQPQKLNKQDAARVRAFMPIRDTINKMLARQAEGAKSGMEDLRAELNAGYDAFVKAFGPINLTNISTSTRKNGKTVTIKKKPNFTVLREDIDAYKVSAIEVYDEKTGEAKKAAIFTEDIVAPYVRPPVTGPADALAVSLSEVGYVDMKLIAEQLGMSEKRAAEELGDAVYLNPKGERWQTAAQYLSGDVVAKLADAKTAAELDPKYARNVTALESAQPVPLTRNEITIPFGASYIPEDVIADFLEEKLGSRAVRVSLNPVTKRWSAQVVGRIDGAAAAEWGTPRKGVTDIIEAALNSAPVMVWNKLDDGTRVRDEKAEELARAKVTLLKEAFTGQIYPGAQAAIGGWVWENEDRATRMEALYNHAMNRIVKEQHDGSHLTFPGLARVVTFGDGTTGNINLTPARVNAIWRIIQNGNTLIDHVVGAGKTWTSIMAVMEMKRLGQIRRPMFVVPNHMLMQFSNEFLQAYPGAKLLVATKDNMSRDRRAEFAAKAAAEKWDGIIITHSAFSRLKMQESAYRDYYAEMYEQMEAAKAGEDEATVKDINNAQKKIAELAGKKEKTVKEEEKGKAKVKAKGQRLTALENKDEGITFEELGVDHLTVDEAHLFKNLWFMTRHTRVKGLSNASASQRATDLYIKIRYLEKSRPGRSALFLTGTPLSNTMAEVYTMMRYLMGPTLEDYQISEFDSWAQTFGMIDTRTELASNSRDLTDVTSFSKFVNIPELSTLYGQMADTQTADSLGLQRPAIKGGMPQVIQSDLSRDEQAMLDAIIDEMEHLPAKEKKQKFLPLFTKGLQASTDPRLVDPSMPYNPDGKIGKAVSNIFRIWQEGNADPKAPNKGQIVFLDMGVPGSKAKARSPEGRVSEDENTIDTIDRVREGLADTAEEGDEDAELQPEKSEDEAAVEKMLVGKFNLYQDIKDHLVEKGVPADQIAFIHDAKTDDQKAKMFEDMREGKLRVLIGSTGKMGVGTNVQKRLIALHHIDAPWRPSDLEQRDGRIVRQGNKNPEVQIYRYITQRSFEAYRWQILERKASFIAQFRAGARGLRIAEDIDSPLPDASEIKAAATGDSRIMEYADLDRTVRGLLAQASAHSGVPVRARQSLANLRTQISMVQKRIATLEEDAARVVDTRGENFKMTIALPNGKSEDVTERKKAGEALKRYLGTLAERSYYGREIEVEFGEISGFQASGYIKKGPDGVEFRPMIVGTDTYRARQSSFLTEDTKPVSLVQQYERLVAGVPELLAEASITLAQSEKQIPALEAKSVATPFPKQAELEEKQKKLAELAQALKPKKVDPNAVPVLKVGEPLVVSNMPVATWQKLKLDLKMGQPFSTVEGMLELAAVAHEKLTQICQSIAEKLGVKFRSAPLKKQTRIAEKLNGRDPRNITDAARGGFDVESVAVSDEVVNALAEALRVVDEGWSVTPGGYFDRKVMVVFDNDVVGEIQMWPPGMFEAKENGGHKLYEEARRPSTADEDRARLEAQMRELYTEVVRHMPEDFQSLVSSASAAAISKSGNVAASSVRETLGASPSEAPMMGAAGPVSTSPEMGSRKTASSSVVTAGPPSQLKYPNFMAGSSEQDIGPNGEKVQSNAQSAAPVSVADFAKSVADLKAKLSQEKPRSSLIQDDVVDLEEIKASIREFLPAIAEPVKGNRLPKVQEATKTFVAGLQEVVTVARQHEAVDTTNASYDDLDVFTDALDDLGSIITEKLQEGYEVTEELSDYESSLIDAVDEIESDYDTIASDADSEIDLLNSIMEDIVDRLPEEDETDTETTALSLDRKTIIDELPQWGDGENLIDAARREVAAMKQLWEPLYDRANEVWGVDTAEMTDEELKAYADEVSNISMDMSSLKWHADFMVKQMAEKGRPGIESAFATIRETMLEPALNELDALETSLQTRRNAEVDRMNEGFDEDGNPIEAASLAGTEPIFSEVSMPADSGAEARILSLTRNRLRVHARSLFAAGLDKKAFDAAISAIGDDTGLQGKDWIAIAEAYTGGPVNGWAASGAVKAIKKAFAERVHDVSLAELGGFDPSVSGSNLDWREDARRALWQMAERLPEESGLSVKNVIHIATSKTDVAALEGMVANPEGAKKIMAVSLAYGPDVAMQTFTHEEIHLLRDLKFFTGKEWSVLSKLATRKPKKSEAIRLIDKMLAETKIDEATADKLRANAGDVTYRQIYDIDNRYALSSLSEEKLVEEVIAHAAADWADGHDFGTRIERLMMKIRDLIEALGNFLRGNGFETVDSIFNSVWSGQVAARAQAEGGQEGPPIEGYPVVQTQAPIMASIPGQHASGARFNKFSDEKVGTGIDAGRKDKTGLYGPGHYITTSPEKSDLYKQQFGPNGVVYDVEITREPDEFLNWHQPLSAQGVTGEKIANAIAARGFMTREEALNIRRGEEVLLALGSGQKEHYKAIAAEALKKLGVAGIAYTDTIDNFRSRHWDFVVFNGDDIRITHVNGEATPETMDAYGMMLSLAGGDTSYMALGTGNVTDANTGDVLYSLAGENGGDATLNNAIDTLKRSLGIQVSQNLFGVTIKAGNRSVRINPRSNILGQTSRTTGGIGVRRSRDIRAIAHEGGHSLEIMLGNKLNALKAKYADSLVAPFAPDTPMPKLTAQGFSGLELDDVEQTALADAVRTQNLLMQWSTKVGNAKSAPRMIGKPQYDEAAYRKVEADAGAARAQLIRLVGKTRADGLMDEVRAKAPQNAPQFIQERFSPMGAPKRRTTVAPSGEALSEAFARWFEKYTMSRESAYDMAPQFFDAFEDLLEAEAPTVLEGMHTVQQQYKDWTKRASVEELASDVVSVSSQNDWASIADGKKTFKDTVTGWAADAYTGVIDDLSPVQMVVRRLLAVADKNGVTDADGKPLSLKVAENPYKIARMFRGSYATGYTWIKDGIPNHGESRVAFPGLQAAMDKIFDRNTWDEATYKAFGQYLISKRALAEFDRLATKKKRLADIDSILKQGSAVWAQMTTEQAKDQEKLDRRNVRHIRLDAIRRDRTNALRRAKSEERDIQERMQDLRDDLAEAMRAIDDGSDAARAVRDRKRRSLQNAERKAREARNQVVDLEQELQDIDMEWTMLGNEIVNLRKATESRQPQIDAIEQSVALLKKERDRTANRGASRPPTLESQDWHQEFISKVESNKKYAKFAEAAQIVYQFTQGLLTIRHQAGLISDDLFRELSGRSGWYVPFMRDMSDAQPESVFTGNGGGKAWSPFKKFDGSDRAIINPLEILSQEAYAAAQHIAMNEAVGALAALAQKAGPGSANIAEVMERTEDLENNPDTWSRIRDVAMSMGIDEADATLMAQRMEMNFANADLQAIWSPGVKGPITKPTLPLWQKGERRHVMLNDPEFGHDALQAMMGLGKEEMNWILELFGKPARLLQVGVTTHPTFMPRNLVRDVFDAWIKTGALPVVTQIRGAKELYGDGEFLRKYTAAGGILGGRNIAALTSKEQQADLMELDPNKVRHGSAALGAMAVGITGTIMGGPLGGLAGSILGYAGARHGGLLKMVEAVESMTRLGVAAHAYKRAMIHNPNLTEQEAMLEAAFVARDVFDWNRRGSKSLALVRTITFLNAQLQGLDRAARAIGGAGDRGSAVKKQIAAVFRREHDVPLSKDEERDLGEAYKTFARLALYTAFLLALYAMYRDDDRYEDIKDQTKATHSWLPGFLGVDVRLPKAFEWAMPANFIEVLWDKMEGRDPDIGDRWRKSMQQVLVPPGVPQGLNLLVGWTTNKDMQSIAPWMFGDSADKVNRTIVSDELKKLAPEQQFDAFTSQLSKDIAVAMVKAGVPEGMIPSPKMIDFTIRTGGYWGSDMQKAYQMSKESLGYPAGPQPRVPDWPIVGGFTGVAARQSKSIEELYNLMSQQGGEFTTAAATYKNMMDKAGDPAGAEAFLNRLEPEARAYAILAYNFTAADKRRHPLERASAVAKITRDIRKEIVLDRLAPQKKEGRKSVYDFDSRIDPPPPVKTQVQDIMERLAQAESWNAFVALGRPGWEGKKEMATKPILDELKAAAPDVYGLFKDREDKAKIEDFETVRKEWPKMRDELLRNGADAKI